MNKVQFLAVLGAVLVTGVELLALDYYTARAIARSPAHEVRLSQAA